MNGQGEAAKGCLKELPPTTPDCNKGAGSRDCVVLREEYVNAHVFILLGMRRECEGMEME